MSRPVERGVVLIGDAAHSTSPQLGQGVNLALCDALALAEALEAEPDTEQALARYARMRRSTSRFYTRARRWLTPFFQSHLAPLGPARDLAFPLAQRLPWQRGQMIRSMSGLKRGVFRRSVSTQWRPPS